MAFRWLLALLLLASLSLGGCSTSDPLKKNDPAFFGGAGGGNDGGGATGGMSLSW
jgi:hypothetical protein